MKDKGFTLIELMIVVAILGILTSITIPAVQQASLEAQGQTTSAAPATESTSFFTKCTTMCGE